MKRLHHRLLEKITGISIFNFGISWNHTDIELEVASQALTFLEDRQVLYSPVYEDCPRGVIDSVLEIRDYLQNSLQRLINRDSSLFKTLNKMLAMTRFFLTFKCRGYDDTQLITTCKKCPVMHTGCADKLILYRRGIGFYITELCIDYELDIDQSLYSILPLKELNQNYGDERYKRKFKEELLHDITIIIRSLQRAEENPECFLPESGSCDRTDCAWHIYCLGGIDPVRKQINYNE